MTDPSNLDVINKKTSQLETELQEFRQLFSMSLDLICIADIHSSTFLKVNPAFQNILGYSEKELLNRPFFDFIHPDDIESTQAIVKEKLRQGSKVVDFENRYRCKDGSYKWLSWVSHPNPEQGRTYAIARDITEQKQMAKERNESEKKYRSLFYNAQVALFRTSIDGRIIEINRQYAEIAGYDNIEECMANYRPQTAWKDPEARNDFLKKIQKTGSVRDYEAQIVRKDGTDAWILFSATVYPDQGHIEGSIVNITDRKRAEEAIRQSEALKRKMFANIGDVIVIIDKEGINRYKSPNIKKLFGWTPEEVVGKSTWENIHPDDLSSQQNFFRALMEAPNAVRKTECRYKCKDGSYKWIEFIGTNLVHDPDIGGILGNYHDITDRKAADDSLRESEARFKVLHNASFGGIAIHDKGIILECNQGLSEITGYSVDELIGMNGLLLIAEQSRSMVMDKILSGDEKPYEAVGLRKNGDEYPIRLEARNIPYKGKNVRTVEFRDITEQKKVEQDREKLQGQLTQAQKIAKVGHYLFDIKKNSWTNSPELNNIFGIDNSFKKDISGWIQIVHPDYQETMSNYLQNNVLSQHQKFDMEYKIIDWTTGQEKWVRGLGDLKLDENNEPIEMFGTIQDITDRRQADKKQKELEASLIQAQKMESVGRLAGGVAHDFNNMLSIILGNIEIAKEDIEQDDPLLSRLYEIEKAAQRSADLTRQLLAFARKQTISPKVINPNHTIESMLKMLKRLIGEDIDLLWHPKKHLWPVKIDPSQIDQIMANLCVNARDAIKGVGKITIETDNICFDDNYCREHQGFSPGAFVLIGVSDNGCGMAKETIDKLFEPFFTTKVTGEGTGLGLATVYGIIKQNNGFINIYSEPGQGTTFKLYLPRHQGSQTEAHVIAKTTPQKGYETILLVEDDRSILHMTKTILERLGYSVLAADTPEEAIRLGSLSNIKIDLLITDVVMPTMNGRELVEKMRHSLPDMKILYMSGYTANVIAHRGILDEGLNFINKPFSKQDIAMKLREILDENK